MKKIKYPGVLGEKAIHFIKNALAEDIGAGDHTTLACIPENQTARARIITREPCVIAGISVAEETFKMLNPRLEIVCHYPDGSAVKAGEAVMEIAGKARDILTAERTALNFLQRMSGIATLTHTYVKAVEGTKAKILDTRKTTPGFRYFEKMAVKLGGGVNHRMGLWDMIMIKDNHIDCSGGIENALNLTFEYLKNNQLDIPVLIEARTLDDVKRILKFGGIQRIMLDNFTLEQAREAVKIIAGAVETEITGGVTLENVRDYAETGVDYISVGALTHSYRSIDLSLSAAMD